MIRVHRCESTEDGFVMPVFFLIATKLRAAFPPSSKMVSLPRDVCMT
jgi:hypothetical protein